MKKSLFKFSLFLVLGLSFLLVNITDVKASDDDSVIQITDDGLYYDTERDRTFNVVYQVVNGELIEIPIEEYIEMREQEKEYIDYVNETINIEPFDLISDVAPAGLLYTYTASRTTKVYLRGDRVSQKVRCPNSSCSKTIGYSKTQSWTASMSLNVAQRNAIGGGAGFSWTNSATVSSSATLNIPAGHEGWWEFDPYMNFTTGTLKNRLTGTEWHLNAYSPIKLPNGNLDGTLFGVVNKI